jgi:uncharacterized protein (DUF608 family)
MSKTITKSEEATNVVNAADAVQAAAEETKEVIKKGRTKAVHEYTFSDQTINLNGYVATCNRTGNEKKFYHSYLANLIVKKYCNSFAYFEDNYVSREGKGLDRAVDQVAKIEEQIKRYQDRIDSLRSKLNTL